ncbi:MAG: phage tail tape measure protein [Phycisphaerales bacterium]
MALNVGTLNAFFGLDDKQFDKKLDADKRKLQDVDKKKTTAKVDIDDSKFNAKVRAMGPALNKAANVGAVGFTALSAGIVKSMLDYANYGDAVRDTMRLTGDTVEQASSLTGQWTAMGISMEDGSTAMKTFTKNLYAVYTGAAKENPFGDLGVAVKDSSGNMRQNVDVMEDVRTALSELDSSTERTATSLKIFGKGGDDMLAWLMKTPDELAALNEQIDENGLIWSGDDLTKYKESLTAQRDMKLALAGIEQVIAKQLVPAMTPLVNSFAWLLEKIGPLAKAIPFATVALGAFVGVVKGAQLYATVANWVKGFGAAKVAAVVAAEETTAATSVETAAIAANTAAIDLNTVARTANGAIPLGAGSLSTAAPLAGSATSTAALGAGMTSVAALAAGASAALTGLAIYYGATYKQAASSPSANMVTGGSAGYGRFKGTASEAQIEQSIASHQAGYKAGYQALQKIAGQLANLKPSESNGNAIDQYQQQLRKVGEQYPEIKSRADEMTKALEKQKPAWKEAAAAAAEAAETARDEWKKTAAATYKISEDLFNKMVGTLTGTTEAQLNSIAAGWAVTVKEANKAGKKMNKGTYVAPANADNKPVPYVPKAGKGAFVPRSAGGTLFVIGEGSRDEVVAQVVSQKGRQSGNTWHINIGSVVGTDRAAARRLAQQVKKVLQTELRLANV